MRLQRLWKLQELDQSLDQITKEGQQKELVLSLKDNQAKVKELEEYLLEENQKVEALEKEVEIYEEELNALQEKKKNFDDHLYSGKVSIPKEIDGLRTKIDELDKKISELEEKILTLMDQNEDKVQVLNQKNGELEELKKAYRKSYKGYKKVKNEMDRKKVEEEDKKEQMLDGLEEKNLETYDVLQSKFNFNGIARIVNDRCSGCRINIPIMQLKSIRVGNTAQYCEHCRRLLVDVIEEETLEEKEE